MGSTWQSLLEELARVRGENYRTEPDRVAAVVEHLEWIVQTMLEKLRDSEQR